MYPLSILRLADPRKIVPLSTQAQMICSINWRFSKKGTNA
jgi:hypothetical protein